MFDGWTREDADVVKTFFGKPARVLTAAWILGRGGEAFFQQEATDGLRAAQESASAVQKVLEGFVFFGLLSTYADGRRRYYVQVEHPLWAAYEGIASACGIGAPTNASVER